MEPKKLISIGLMYLNLEHKQLKNCWALYANTSYKAIKILLNQK